MTGSKRSLQAQRVIEIFESRWKKLKYRGNFVILGDLNDSNDDHSSISNLTRHKGLVNVVERLPIEEQWTHHFAPENTYSQLVNLQNQKNI